MRVRKSTEQRPSSAYFPALRPFGAFFLDPPELLSALAIKKSSSFLPPLIAAVSQRGLRPRPAQVSAGLPGLRYLGATDPVRPPRPNLMAFPPRPPKPESLESCASSSRRRSVTFAPIAASILLFRSCNLATDIVLRAIMVFSSFLDDNGH